jgi:surface protein
MAFMFHLAENFNQPIGNWNVSNVTNMTNMFERAKRFNENIGNWNVSGVTNMHRMFIGFNNSTERMIFNQNLSLWVVNQVTDVQYMFANTEMNKFDSTNYSTLAARAATLNMALFV